MLARDEIRAPEAQPAAAAVYRALDLLGRASADWRNGGSCESGALHWPVAVTLARSELRRALEAFGDHGQVAAGPPGSACEREASPSDWLESSDADALAGLAWYQSASLTERRHWHQVARSAVPADAWEAYKAGAAP